MANDDDRKELLDRFLNDMRTNPSQAFYTEEELIEIFDYANDFDNDFARCEVLHFGASHYPDSDNLRVRRGFQYLYQGMDSAVIKQMLAPVSPDHLLGRLLNARLDNSIDLLDMNARLDELFASVGTFTDEEVIQFIDLAADTDSLDWIVANHDKILSKSSYKPTALYEMADVLNEAGRYEEASKLFEQLTEIEPFNVDFWNRLTETYGSSENYPKALESVDYALAIDPKHPHSKLLKARVLFSLQREPEEVVKLLSPIALDIAKSTGSILAVQILATTYSWLLKKDKKALELLQAANDILPTNEEILYGLILMHDPDILNRSLRLIQLSNELTPEDASNLILRLTQENPGNPALPAEVAYIYYMTNPDAAGIERMFSLLYMAKRYDDIIELWDTAKNSATGELPKWFDNASASMATVMSLLRSKDKERREEGERVLAAALLNLRKDNLSDILRFKGMQDLAMKFFEFLGEHPNYRSASLDKIDPFITESKLKPKPKK